MLATEADLESIGEGGVQKPYTRKGSGTNDSGTDDREDALSPKNNNNNNNNLLT